MDTFCFIRYIIVLILHLCIATKVSLLLVVIASGGTYCLLAPQLNRKRLHYYGSVDQTSIKNGTENVQQLSATNDDFGGVMVVMDEHMDSDVFRTLLQTSMSQWKLQGKKGVWIKLPIKNSNLVDAAVKEGFWYHHAEPEHLMLLYWIPKTVNPIPANASHVVRVGAIVLNDKQEMLVVQEKLGPLRGVWKICTGTVDQGEDIPVGVVREVKEETGVDTEFVQVLAFSQEHNVFFGKSQVFFICMMRPLSSDIQIQETEIEAAKWMPLEEYASQICPQELKLRKYITELCIAKVERDYSGFSPKPITSDSNLHGSYIYYNNSDLNNKCHIGGGPSQLAKNKNQVLSDFRSIKEPHRFQSQNKMLFSFFTVLCFVGSGLIMVSGDTDIPVQCEYPCQPIPPLPPPPARPLYGTPPPPSEPVYETPPSPTEPVYETPPSPTQPLCEPPPSPQPPSPTGPLYGVSPPPSPPGNCPPSVQNCVYTHPNGDVYQSIDSGSDMPLYCLHVLALASLIFLPWLLC
ncbi:hypothetical protein LXL04_031042 [Taraxacum kok-saghyz]